MRWTHAATARLVAAVTAQPNFPNRIRWKPVAALLGLPKICCAKHWYARACGKYSYKTPTPEEHRKVHDAVAAIGTQWALIARFVVSTPVTIRHANWVKNVFHSAPPGRRERRMDPVCETNTTLACGTPWGRQIAGPCIACGGACVPYPTLLYPTI
jgi:hypothetical protein